MVNLRNSKSTATAKRFTLHRDDIAKDSNGWRTKPVQSWFTEDIMQWIQAVAIKNNLNYENIQMHKFSDVTGLRLDKMRQNEFIERDKAFGEILYDALQRVGTTEEDDKPIKKSRGRPPGSKRDRIAKTKKPRFRLWEFLLDLLSSPEYCPSLITWENQDEGLFKIVQSEQVAKLWGNFRGNKNMDYAKMTRLMRYYYDTKMLEQVKQRLVYRFGPNAPWKAKQKARSLQ